MNLASKRETSFRLYVAAAALAILTALAIFADLPVARTFPGEWIPGDLRRVFSWAEVVAHGVGVALIGLTVLVLDPTHRRHVPRLLAAAYVSGILANLGKLLIARIRPRFFDLHGNVWDSFLGWLPGVLGTNAEHEFGFDIQSFPSGHAATAVGFAIGLARLYPHGRWLFYGFACLAAAQRLEVHAHYLSDTLGGAAVACLGAAWVYDPRVLGRLFDRIERPSKANVAAEGAGAVD